MTQGLATSYLQVLRSDLEVGDGLVVHGAEVQTPHAWHSLAIDVIQVGLGPGGIQIPMTCFDVRRIELLAVDINSTLCFQLRGLDLCKGPPRPNFTGPSCMGCSLIFPICFKCFLDCCFSIFRPLKNPKSIKNL